MAASGRVEVREIEIVTRIDAEAEVVRQRRRCSVGVEALLRCLRAVAEGARERLGVELDAIRGERRGPPHGCGSGSTKTLTRMPAPCRSPTIRRIRSTGVSAAHPAWLVTSPARTGTSVHWFGLTSIARSNRSGRGSPSMLYSIAARPAQLAGDVPHVRCRDVPRVGARMHRDARRTCL